MKWCDVCNFNIIEITLQASVFQVCSLLDNGDYHQSHCKRHCIFVLLVCNSMRHCIFVLLVCNSHDLWRNQAIIRIGFCRFCGTSEAKRHLGIALSVVRPPSVCPSVTLCFCWRYTRNHWLSHIHVCTQYSCNIDWTWPPTLVSSWLISE